MLAVQYDQASDSKSLTSKMQIKVSHTSSKATATKSGQFIVADTLEPMTIQK